MQGLSNDCTTVSNGDIVLCISLRVLILHLQWQYQRINTHISTVSSGRGHSHGPKMFLQHLLAWDQKMTYGWQNTWQFLTSCTMLKIHPCNIITATMEKRLQCIWNLLLSITNACQRWASFFSLSRVRKVFKHISENHIRIHYFRVEIFFKNRTTGF